MNFAFAHAFILGGASKERIMSNPNDKVDHSSKAPLKSDMKAGVSAQPAAGREYSEQGRQAPRGYPGPG